MNCFYHRDKPALGLCKSCGRGICEECLAEIPDGLACKGRCEERATLISRVIDHSNAVRRVSNQQVRSSALFYLALGVGMLLFGAWTWFDGRKELLALVCYMLVFGAAIMIYGIYGLQRKSRYPDLK